MKLACHLKGQKEVDRQTDAAAVALASELGNALQNGNIVTVANNPTATTAGLQYDVHMSDCENRWVSLYHKPDDREYIYGFVYIDPQAGFTLQYGGHFTIDQHEMGTSTKRPILYPRKRSTLRFGSIKTELPPCSHSVPWHSLVYPEKPDWLKFYKDKADPVTHEVSWGFFYNAVGDPRRAIDYL